MLNGLSLADDVVGELVPLLPLTSPRNWNLRPGRILCAESDILNNSGGLPEYLEMINDPLSAVGFCSKYNPS